LKNQLRCCPHITLLEQETVVCPYLLMKKGLGEELWREKEKLAPAWLEETLPTLKRPLTSDAWLCVGVKRYWAVYHAAKMLDRLT